MEIQLKHGDGMQELAGSQIGRYQIQRRLARGGMSEIYLARDSETDHQLAIKMVHTSASEYCERFQREVKAMAGLTHDHILPALDYGEYESWCYLVMPYIEHGTLSERIAQGPISLEETGRILEQLCCALQYAHEQGIVHRDIKPSNVLLRDGYHVYLADFGLVKRVGEDTGLTITGFLIGTPEYMAPELAEEEASPRCDIYALGVLLYYMLTGRVPFKASTPMGVYLKHIRELPTPPAELNPAIPAPVEQVILRAMDKNPQQRYQSAQELSQGYQQALAHEEQQRHAMEEVTRARMAALEAPQVRLVKQKPRKWRSLLAVALLPVFLLMIALLPGLLSPSQTGKPAVAQGVHANTHRPIKPIARPIPSPTPTPKPSPTPAKSVSSPANTSTQQSQNNTGGNSSDTSNANNSSQGGGTTDTNSSSQSNNGSGTNANNNSGQNNGNGSGNNDGGNKNKGKDNEQGNDGGSVKKKGKD